MRKSVFKPKRLLLLYFVFIVVQGYSQVLSDIGIKTENGLRSDKIILSDSSVIIFMSDRPLYSFLVNDKLHNSTEAKVVLSDNVFLQNFENHLSVKYKVGGRYDSGEKSEIIFENNGNDTISLSNVVPFGENAGSVYLTAKGAPDLARAWLFRPGFQPLRVILPDDAWETGYSSFVAGKDYSVCSVARRTTVDKGEKKRYETIMAPGTKVVYSVYTEVFKGEWQNGLRRMFRDRYLFDLEKFDNHLYERKDLSWIKSSYLIILQMAWDKDFYDRFRGKYTYGESFRKETDLFGNIDVFGIWPTWPRLGLDQRNQWDMYRDLPGGTEQLKNISRVLRQSGTRFFIEYNPWDSSTRQENHINGLAQLISETEADGVVLDTKGSSGIELQSAADSVRAGVIMYSEGMAVPKDMPGIISGRVHNAIFMSPELNLNKLIKPDFSIFRVCDVGEDILHREIAVSFFNGYGTELNLFRPGGRNENYNDDLNFLAHTTFILRQNNDAFLDNDWVPLLTTKFDNVYVNKWHSGEKSIFTILNMRSDGVDGKLFAVDLHEGKHFVSLWNHEDMKPEVENGNTFIKAHIEGWQPSFSGTRKEGSVDCIAEFPDLIKAHLTGDSIKISGKDKGRLLIWKGNPAYGTISKELGNLRDTTIRVKDIFGYYEGKIVLQLIDNKLLKDENVLTFKGGKPWLVSRTEITSRAEAVPSGMVLVPGTQFKLNATADDQFIPYPEINGNTANVDTFLIDRFPVTNQQYYEFIMNTGYRPADTTNYLRNWQSGMYVQGQENYPVVYVSYEDMTAYSKWAQKRLPTQAEWQLAAQSTDQRKWPWGNDFHGTYCNNSFGRPTPVDAFSKGQSPYGVFDMVGNVWQMTNDIYFNGTDYFSIIRGGSYYKPESGSWYIEGGPQPLDKTQMLLMVSPGFDRSPVVGFRCVKDVNPEKIKKQ